MKVAVIGAGRIGRVHIENICAGVREMEIKTVRIILTGKANGLTDEAIRERMRETYV